MCNIKICITNPGLQTFVRIFENVNSTRSGGTFLNPQSLLEEHKALLSCLVKPASEREIMLYFALTHTQTKLPPVMCFITHIKCP